MSTSSSSFGIDFGQKVDLTASIRNILRNYPEGTSILKELVQNADDAGAKEISFCLDKRSYSTNKIASQSLSEFQGPSLLVYNNACFTENDFQSIQRIGDSLKKTDEQKSKIGRFGIGFNSVYHLTDLPSFVSSSYLVMLDPQAKFLPDVNPSNPGKMVNFVSNPDIVASLSDQFKPYETYGVNWSSPYNGTLFRLPLRTTSQASTSLLSKRTITPDDAEALLASLQNEASAMLLFLKNIERLEIKLWTSNSQIEPELLFSCSISNMTPTLERYRSFVGDAVRFSNSSAAAALSGRGPKSTPGSTARVQLADFTLRIQCQQIRTIEFEEIWEVCNQLGGGECSRIADDPNHSLLRLVPWGGVAALVSSTQQVRLQSHPTGGLAYCFLPLPVQTGLPVMVNGFFELSSNRRDVWQAGVDMEGDGRTRAEWNISLMKDIISPSYVRLLLRLRNSLGFSEYFQSLWPSIALSAPWSQVSITTLQSVRRERLMRLHHSANKQMTSIAPPPVPSNLKEKTFFSRKSQVTPPPQVEEIDESWIECHSAVLLPDPDNLMNEEELSILCHTLVKTQHPVVVCLQSLKQNLIKSRTCELLATPDYTRNALRINDQKLDHYFPPPMDCRFLLRYCVSDIPKAKPTIDMNLLPLLPLANGSIGVLRMISERTYQNSLELLSMGFSVSQTRYALARTNNDVAQACELLTTSNLESLPSDSIASVFIVCHEELQRIFRTASNTLLHTASLGVSEVEYLTSQQMEMYSNVRPFSPPLIPDLLRQILPKECFQNTPVQIATLGVSTERVLTFLKEFWPYASLHPPLISASVEGAAIVPTRDGLLLPLSRLSNIISQQRADVTIPSNVIDILELLGGHILDPTFISSPSMPQIFWEYVASSSRSGVLSILDSLGRQSKSKIDNLSLHQRCELLSFLSTSEPVTKITAAEAVIVKNLPIFQVKNGGEFIRLSPQKETAQYAALRNSERLSPDLFPSYYLNFSSPQELQLLSFLGVSVLQRSQYFIREFLPRAPLLHDEMPELVELDLFEMMTELVSLIDEDKKIPTVLKDSKCIPNGSLSSEMKRTLHKPSELFDPSEPELYALLDESFFPAPEFQRDDVLVHLRSAGLNTTLDWPGVIACAKSIESFVPPQENSATTDFSLIRKRRGLSLLDFLLKNIGRLLGEENKSEKRKPSIFSLRGLFGSDKPSVDISSIEDNIKQLLNIRWIPIQQTPLDKFMPWSASLTLSEVASPRMCRPVSDAWMCSSTMCFAANQIHSNTLLRVLGWNETLPINVIAIQLKELAAKYISNCDQLQLEATEIQLARERITALIPILYQRLNGANNDEVAIILSILNSHPWIWVGHAFVHPSKVAYTSALSLAPYLYAVPQDLAVYKRLLDMFGIKQSFYARDFVDVLRQMAIETNANTSDNETKDSNKKAADVIALSDIHIDLAVSLVTFLSAEGGGSGGESFRPLDHTIYVPDSLGKLSLATDLVTDDVPWLTGVEYSNARSGIRLCHPHIASKVAHRVGVRSLRLMLVDRSVDTLFSESESHVEAFGQAESLTGRLRTILDMYPDGNPILAELIQNADDAGASVVKIMIDENTYPTESLMDTTVAPLQGPSLIFCNDSKFSESDFRSLARIGQGSKLEKLSATGRFGLGFNSVYHLTDTPSFVSGEHLVIFDPHTSFIPGTTPSQPGLRMKFLGNSLKNTFPDQFRPYQYFGCNFENSFDGTLFRFPLRTPSLARRSEISKRYYSIQDVNHLLENLTTHLANHLIFLRSVTTIEIFRCCEGGTPSLVQRATSRMSNLSAYNDQSLLRHFDKKFSVGLQASELNQGNSTTRDSFYTQLASTPDHKLPSCAYHLHIQTEVVDEILSSDKSSKPISQVTKCIEYLVVTGIRGGKAKAMACDSNTRHLKLMPMGSIAACVRNTSDQASIDRGTFPTLDGLAFCFLPLPVKTNLPVHVNAYFELSSNRRDIWRGDDTTGESKVRGEWNTRLMEDVLAPLYVLLLTKLAHQMKKNQIQQIQNVSTGDYPGIRERQSGIYSLIPSIPTSFPWNIVRHTVLTQIKDIELLWSNLNGGRYLPVGKAIILPDSRRSPNSNEILESAEIMDQIEKILLMEEIPLAIVPLTLYKSLQEVNVASEILSPSFVRKHFKLKAIHPSISPPNMANASFLLEYCLRDNPPPTDLYGLQLVPLEKTDTLGCIGDPTDPPLYLATDYERKLLSHVGQCIIASDPILGSRVSSVIRSPLFCEHCNVQYLTPLNTLKLLQNVVPSHWFSSGTPIVNRFEIVNGAQRELVSLDWIQGVWAYILETKSLHLFEKILPIVPVLQPPTLPKGSYLVKFSFEIPIVHMSFQNTLTPEAFRGISGLGLYIFDPSALGPIAYSQEMSLILCEPSPRGFLRALSSVQDRISTVSATWSDEIRDAIRTFLLDVILGKLDNLSPEEIEMLESFPVFESHQIDKGQSEKSFSPLRLPSGELLSIPPRNMNQELLDHHFVKIRSERDRTLFAMMGLREPSSGIFYSTNVLPSISNGSYSESTLATLSTELLRLLPTLEIENPGFTEQLKNIPFVRSCKGHFCRPNLLYDPHAPYLPSLLPPDAFPCPKLYRDDGILLASLRLVGLSTDLTISGVLHAAESIHRDFEGNRDEDGNGKVTTRADMNSEKRENIQRALQRSLNLLRYLDVNIQALTPPSESNDWIMKLKEFAWIPVCTDPPSASQIAGITPPWPQPLNQYPLARPSQCCLNDFVWLCSTTYRIVKFEPQSQTLIQLLGWCSPISGRCATSQLLSIINMYSSSSSPERISEVCYKVVPRIYSALIHALENENELETEIWLRSLRGKPFVWTSGSFVEPNRISFTPLSSINTEPYLFVAKGELLAYRTFLIQLGVKEAFDVTDLTLLLRDLSVSYGSSPLPAEKVDMCIGIIKIIVRLLLGENESIEKEHIDSDDDDVENSEVTTPEKKLEEMLKNREAIGDVFLPDRNNVLTLAKSLSFDDAPWISSQLSTRGIRFIHRSIDNEAASLLGANSLREQLFSGDAIVCPDLQAIREVIQNDSVEDSLGDLIGLADRLGSPAVHIVLDEQTHPCESLVHPGLAAAQGTSIVIYIENITLSIESLTQLLISPARLPQIPPTFPSDGIDCSIYNSIGKRLHATFAITDCLQVLSGNQFYVFDPCGQYLIGSGDDRENISAKTKLPAGTRAQSKAQRYLLNGKDNQSMLNRFPDQFEGFLSLPLIGSWISSFKAMENINGTILRMPLRKEISAISSHVIPSESLHSTLKNLIGRIEGALIFGLYLNSVSIQHCHSNLSNESLEIKLSNAPQTHFVRRKTIGDTSWKKSGGMFVWNKPVSTAEASYRAMLVYQHLIQGHVTLSWFENPDSRGESKSAEFVSEWQTEWLTYCLQGVEANRSLASRDPYKRLDLQPFISISAPIWTPDYIRILMKNRNYSSFSRYVYCNGGNLGGSPSGLPFHVDGSFLMNMSSRGLSLPDASTRNRSNQTTLQVVPLDLLHQWNLGLFLGSLEVLAPALLTQIRDEFVQHASSPADRNDLRTFYAYWPYIPRILPNLAAHLCRSKLISLLSSKELFLSRSGFGLPSNLYLPVCSFPVDANLYLQSCLPCCDIPSQIAKDLLLSQVRVNTLTPAKLRELLKADGQTHCTKMSGRYEIVLPLLQYCLSDIERNSTDGEFVRRKTYRELTGCPLLFMADRQIRCFPTNPREQIVIAPITILAVLPTLRSQLLHPISLQDIGIFHHNSIFKDSLQIVDLSPQFIKDHSRFFLPASWERCDAVDWTAFIAPLTEPVASSAGRTRSNGELEITDLLIYVLWRDVLSRCETDELSPISSLPLFPVIAGEHHILMTPAVAPYLLSTASITSAQENKRAQLRREAGRLKSLVDHDIHLLSERKNQPSLESLFLEDLGKGQFDRLGASIASTSADIELPQNDNPILELSAQDNDNDQTFDTFSSRLLGEALKILRMPMIDGGIFEEIPLVISSAGRTDRLSSGHKILRCIGFIESKHMILHIASSEGVTENGSFLRFDLLSEQHRKVILLEILEAHHQRRLTEMEINQLKTLPLFTSTEGTMVAIASCNGVYWCESPAALVSLSNVHSHGLSTENSTESTIPTVLVADPELREVYNLVGAEELTPLTVVRKFTLPSLSRLEGMDRLRVMTDLSSQWDLYRGDNQVVQLLKTIAFIPSYQDSMTEEFTESKEPDLYDLSRPFRRPDQLFSWTNRELFSALAGSQQNEYFPPPALRTTTWHSVMVDLGLPLDLDKEALMRVATDIQKTANKFRVDRNEDALSLPGGPRDRGMALLRYLKDGDRAATLFDINLARRLGKISFVPVLHPIGVEQGGFVVYKPDLCRFEQTLAGSKGALGFTCMPVLSDDLSPPQTFFSALGITSSPTIDVVLRHLRNLTTSGESLDRWNSVQYSIKDTFGEIFVFLNDNWKSISPTIQSALETTNIVPIGHSIFKPRRLFFRLAEDLNPFMHEIPRYFGQHEQFLKKLGVREKPSSEDYCQFLRELATECKDIGLNPNELRAIIAIIEAINAELEVEGLLAESKNENLFLPDEDSILRDASLCLYNNDGWLRSRLGTDGFGGEIHILHPFLQKAIAQSLQIPLLSEVLVETLPRDLVLQTVDSWNAQKFTIEAAFKSGEFIEMMTSLSLRSRGKLDVSERNEYDRLNPQFHGDLNAEISWKLSRLNVVFIEFLVTEMKILDPRHRSSRSQCTEPMPSLCFVKFDEGEKSYTLLVNSSMLVAPVTASVAIGVGICRLIGLDASVSASVSLLLASIEFGDSDRVFTELRVASDSATIRERSRGVPGAEVIECDRKMTELKPFRVYRLGEIVAYEKVDSSKQSKTLHYARVVAISEEGEAGVRRISLKTDVGVITCLPTEIFSFKSAREITSTMKSPIQEKKPRFSFLSSSNSLKHLPDEKNAFIPDNAPPSQEKDSLVSQNEVVGALQGLLLRAGIPASLENKDLVTRILELESEKKKLESSLMSERSILNDAQESIQRIKSTYSCQICLGASVTHVMTPCGHTICGECLGRMQSNKCPFCRSNITSRVKLFFSMDEEVDEENL